ncbi:hypothetical protein F2P81_013790 [Scophthalmus maximus]|uniref:Uncharacterized protein n=1 Tax=Scophthalmus maximus TaxID=52904 RepID=A0A6A4SRR0_SCOMX|nr:hypothetical protein F2P81_013790 [Scophthalmus maximus]
MAALFSGQGEVHFSGTYRLQRYLSTEAPARGVEHPQIVLLREKIKTNLLQSASADMEHNSRPVSQNSPVLKWKFLSDGDEKDSTSKDTTDEQSDFSCYRTSQHVAT